MGNQLTTNITQYDEKEDNRVSKFIKSKFSSKYNKSNAYEKFIIQHKRTTKNIPNIDIHTLDQRRIVFVSLIGLFRTWKNCPSHLLYSSLLLMPLKKMWIYYPSKYINELKSHFVAQLLSFSDSSDVKKFIALLRWKDSQGFVFWMLDDHTPVCRESLVAPFWYYFNDKLIRLYDPVTNNKYKPLNIDLLYWQNKGKVCNKYKATTSSVLAELFFVKMGFTSMKQLIFDSNPKSLNPIKAFGYNDEWEENTEILTLCDDNEAGNWCISKDYNPYDLNDISVSDMD